MAVLLEIKRSPPQGEELCMSTPRNKEDANLPRPSRHRRLHHGDGTHGGNCGGLTVGPTFTIDIKPALAKATAKCP